MRRSHAVTRLDDCQKVRSAQQGVLCDNLATELLDLLIDVVDAIRIVVQ
jgi:hypothetical protein